MTGSVVTGSVFTIKKFSLKKLYTFPTCDICVQETVVCQAPTRGTALTPVGSDSSSTEGRTVSQLNYFFQRTREIFSLGSPLFIHSSIYHVLGACRKAPETKEFCADHYWYGPNKCDQKYCRSVALPHFNILNLENLFGN